MRCSQRVLCCQVSLNRAAAWPRSRAAAGLDVSCGARSVAPEGSAARGGPLGPAAWNAPNRVSRHAGLLPSDCGPVVNGSAGQRVGRVGSAASSPSIRGAFFPRIFRPRGMGDSWAIGRPPPSNQQRPAAPSDFLYEVGQRASNSKVLMVFGGGAGVRLSAGMGYSFNRYLVRCPIGVREHSGSRVGFL